MSSGLEIDQESIKQCKKSQTLLKKAEEWMSTWPPYVLHRAVQCDNTWMSSVPPCCKVVYCCLSSDTFNHWSSAVTWTLETNRYQPASVSSATNTTTGRRYVILILACHGVLMTSISINTSTENFTTNILHKFTEGKLVLQDVTVWM